MLHLKIHTLHNNTQETLQLLYTAVRRTRGDPDGQSEAMYSDTEHRYTVPQTDIGILITNIQSSYCS